ncbi:TRAP transporter substrate-binding protein DctP [Comamonas kerstersii]
MNLARPLRTLQSYVHARTGVILSLRRIGWFSYAAFSITAAAADAQHTLTVADYRSYLEASHPVPQALQHFVEAFNQDQPGTLRLQRTESVPGAPLQQIQAVQQGKTGAPSIMLAAATGLAELDPGFAFFDQPYAIENAEQAEQFYASAQADAMLQRLHQHGLHGLAWMENGWRIVTADRPLRTLDDLKNLRIRTVPTPVSAQLFTALHATPVSLPANQVRQSLSNGELQAQESFVTLALQQKAHEFHKHVWLTNHSYGAQVLIMNLKAWQALSPEEQHRLQTAAVSAAKQQRIHARQADLQALQDMKALGVQLDVPSNSLQHALKDATRHLRDAPKAAP